MKTENIIALLSAAGSWLTAIGICIAIYEIKVESKRVEEQNKWNRSLYSEQFGLEATKIIREIRKDLIHHFPNILYEKHRPPLSPDQARKLMDACGMRDKQGEFDCDSKRIAFDWLNFLESVASAYWNGVADKDVFMETWGGMLDYEYSYFESFDEIVKKDREYSAWPPLRRFVNQYRLSKERVGDYRSEPD